MAEPQPNSPQPEAPAESAQDEVKDASPAVEEEEEVGSLFPPISIRLAFGVSLSPCRSESPPFLHDLGTHLPRLRDNTAVVDEADVFPYQLLHSHLTTSALPTSHLPPVSHSHLTGPASSGDLPGHAGA